MLRHYVIVFLSIFDLAILAYFLVLNTLYLVFCVVAFVQLRQHRRRRTA